MSSRRGQAKDTRSLRKWGRKTIRSRGAKRAATGDTRGEWARGDLRTRIDREFPVQVRRIEDE